MGRRELYRPIVTPLSRTAQPEDVVQGLLRLHAFATIYVADLDAIEGSGDNTCVVMGLRRRFPHLDIWTDNGIAAGEAVRRWLDENRGTLVLGSELQATSTVALSFVDEPRLVLSLDFRESVFQGPADLLDPSHWPRRVIAMTLARVGGEAGPDFERLRRASPHRAPPASPCGGRRARTTGSAASRRDGDQRRAGGLGAARRASRCKRDRRIRRLMAAAVAPFVSWRDVARCDAASTPIGWLIR